jgi:amidophosphoribosyltransferase
VKTDQVQELRPGHALIVRKNGSYSEEQVREPVEKRACSFERIYFSRGSDRDVYRERIALGRSWCPRSWSRGPRPGEHVFSFIPNTAEVACYGMLKGLEDELNRTKERRSWSWARSPIPAPARDPQHASAHGEGGHQGRQAAHLHHQRDNARDDLVAHVYDITYGTVRPGVDNLVVIDDSIVRGTTLKQSILKMLDRLEPKRIVVVSSAPQIRYPDCYGIDMAKLGRPRGLPGGHRLAEARPSRRTSSTMCTIAACAPNRSCRGQAAWNGRHGTLWTNVVKDIYRAVHRRADQRQDHRAAHPARDQGRGAHRVPEHRRPARGLSRAHRRLVLHRQLPTPGGNRVVNRAFINWREGKNVRAYCTERNDATQSPHPRPFSQGEG